MSDAVQDAVGPGALLRAARERQGLHIAALAAAIKVAPRKLDALENDRWDELPGTTFTRALAQTVCRSLKIDPKPVLDLLPQSLTQSLEPPNNVAGLALRSPGGRDDPAGAGSMVRPMIAAAAVLMVAAIVVHFLPDGMLAGAATGRAAAQAAAASQAVNAIFPPAGPDAVVGNVPLPTEAAPAPAPPASAASVAAGADAAVTAAEPRQQAASAPQTAVAAAAVTPASAAAQRPPAPASAPLALSAVLDPSAANESPRPLKLRATEPSWIEVRDGRGALLLSRVVQAGEDVGLDGSLPIRVTIGNARGTQVAFRGRNVDLLPRTLANVARVELQ
jgi:cytoskeleton protein RodZ